MRRLGLLRRVQPSPRGAALRHFAADTDHPVGDKGGLVDVGAPREGRRSEQKQRDFRDAEPRGKGVWREEQASGQLKAAVPAGCNERARQRAHRRGAALFRGI